MLGGRKVQVDKAGMWISLPYANVLESARVPAYGLCVEGDRFYQVNFLFEFSLLKFRIRH